MLIDTKVKKEELINRLKYFGLEDFVDVSFENDSEMNGSEVVRYFEPFVEVTEKDIEPRELVRWLTLPENKKFVLEAIEKANFRDSHEDVIIEAKYLAFSENNYAILEDAVVAYILDNVCIPFGVKEITSAELNYMYEYATILLDDEVIPYNLSMIIDDFKEFFKINN